MQERGGKVVARVATDLTSRDILKFIRDKIKTESSVLITDEYGAYNAVRRSIDHRVINHSQQYVDGEIHTKYYRRFLFIAQMCGMDSTTTIRKALCRCM